MKKIIDSVSLLGENFAVYQIDVLEDNFSYLLCQNGIALCIDPGESARIETLLVEKNLSLEAILITHFHSDHIGGVEKLSKKRKTSLLGPKHEKLPFIKEIVEDEDEISLGPFTLEVIAAPGHTLDHLMYYFPELSLLFCGDVIFLGGCGKMFEGNEHHYFQSLEKIKKLPPKTQILTGHDYMNRNMEFIQFLDPQFPAEKFKNTTFHTLQEELNINPFLNIDSSDEFLRLYQQREDFRAKK